MPESGGERPMMKSLKKVVGRAKDWLTYQTPEDIAERRRHAFGAITAEEVELRRAMNILALTAREPLTGVDPTFNQVAIEKERSRTIEDIRNQMAVEARRQLENDTQK